MPAGVGYAVGGAVEGGEGIGYGEHTCVVL